MKSRCPVNPRGVHEFRLAETRSSSGKGKVVVVEVKICVYCQERVETTSEHVRTKVNKWD